MTDSDELFTLYQGDCIDIMREMESDSIDSIVTDPPYGLSFMNREWDHAVPDSTYWKEALRVAKPGAHLLAFGGTRVYHRLMVAIEDAGWEIRDCVMWVYSNGFPKSLDVSKAIDKAAGVQREKKLVATRQGNTRKDRGVSYAGESFSGFRDVSEPMTDSAAQWQGWGTALKPAWEPIILARKPFKGTVADNVQQYGTGAINIDDSRIQCPDALAGRTRHGGGIKGNGSSYELPDSKSSMPAGRFPANFIHDGSEEVTELFPRDLDRFFYCAKASKKDREEGLEALEIFVLDENTPSEVTEEISKLTNTSNTTNGVLSDDDVKI